MYTLLVNDAELSELGIALDHRLAEAERGNPYAFWPECGAVLLQVLRLQGAATSEVQELRARLDDLAGAHYEP